MKKYAVGFLLVFVAGFSGSFVASLIASWLESRPKIMGGDWWEVLAAIGTVSAVIVALCLPLVGRLVRQWEGRRIAKNYASNDVALGLKEVKNALSPSFLGTPYDAELRSRLEVELEWLASIDYDLVGKHSQELRNELFFLRRNLIGLIRMLGSPHVGVSGLPYFLRKAKVHVDAASSLCKK